MASEERTRSLLGDAGFTDVRTAEVQVRFAFTDLGDYERWVTDLSGSFAMAIRGLPEPELEGLRAELRVAFALFATQEGYEFGGVALTARRELSYSGLRTDRGTRDPSRTASPQAPASRGPWSQRPATGGHLRLHPAAE